jgi:hypothetical protein
MRWNGRIKAYVHNLTINLLSIPIAYTVVSEHNTLLRRGSATTIVLGEFTDEYISG